MTSASRMRAARYLTDRRAELADDLARAGSGISALLARTLYDRLARAIYADDPTVVVLWCRLIEDSHPAQTIVEAVEFACSAALAVVDASDAAEFRGFLSDLSARVASCLTMRENPAAHENDAQTRAAIDALLAALRARDEITCVHSCETGTWARRLADYLCLDAEMVTTIVRAALLHDVGKLAVPDQTLMKPSGLTGPEWEMMRRHPQTGADILSEIPALKQYAPIVLAHHERIDGLGYPFGLDASTIPYEAKVIAVADAFHAMTSDRPYRPAMTHGEAIATLRKGAGTQWDADLVAAMIDVILEGRTAAVESDLKRFDAVHETGRASSERAASGS